MGEYSGYVGAPYNFVGVGTKVNRREPDALPPHNVIDRGLLSGKITYEMEAMTPVFVSQGKEDGRDKEEFYRDCRGNFAVPGSTVRGLVRSNVQILSKSSVAGDIQDWTLMYRSVAGGKEKDAYGKILGSGVRQVRGKDGKMNSLSVLKNVKAGYIAKEKGKYFIYPSVVDRISADRGKMNYYVVSERKIMEGRYKGFEDLKTMELQNLDKPKDLKTGSPFERVVRGGRIHYVGETNRKYKPYACQVYYLLKGDSRIEEVHLVKSGKELWGKKGFKRGYLLSSGPIREKKVLYVIPEMDEYGERIEISPKDIDSYERDYEGKKNQIEGIDSTFYRLPQEGETKPVFYISLGERLYFGFTPRLRLFYDKSIFAGLSEEQKAGGLDYSTSLFGYSNEKDSYKSRLSFMDARLKADHGNARDARLVLGSPKPTSYLDYLKGENGEPVSYNQDFELRGVKQYWLKEDVVPGKIGKNEKVATRFRPLDKGAVFQGEIRFSNLSREELGLVLWGLLLEEGSNQNIGKGKPYGYGRMEVRLSRLEILDLEALYGDGGLCLKPFRDETGEKDGYIGEIKKELTRLMGRDVMRDPGIRDFLLMKDTKSMPPAERTRYMDLDEREYQGRVNSLVCLPSAKDVADGKKPVVGKREGKEFKDRQGGDRGNRNGNRGGNENGGKGWGGKQNQQRGKRDGNGNGGSGDYRSGGSAGTSMGDLLKGLNLN